MNLTPLQFLLLSQAIIFVLGWPLEWTEIIVIFVPIFLPLLQHFQIDPMLWGVLVFVNLQAAFLSPPVAMSAFYLKGVSPSHVTLNQIFAGMMPYMLIVILCMVLMYIWPGLTCGCPTTCTVAIEQAQAVPGALSLAAARPGARLLAGEAGRRRDAVFLGRQGQGQGKGGKAGAGDRRPAGHAFRRPPLQAAGRAAGH
jgi:hypothetical protein